MRNPRNMIARGQLAYELSQLPSLDETFLKVMQGNVSDIFPEEFIEQLPALKKLSLFELTEVLIRIFRLGSEKEELAYLTAFQDQVLEFSIREKADVTSFLEWWQMY